MAFSFKRARALQEARRGPGRPLSLPIAGASRILERRSVEFLFSEIARPAFQNRLALTMQRTGADKPMTMTNLDNLPRVLDRLQSIATWGLPRRRPGGGRRLRVLRAPCPPSLRGHRARSRDPPAAAAARRGARRGSHRSGPDPTSTRGRHASWRGAEPCARPVSPASADPPSPGSVAPGAWSSTTTCAASAGEPSSTPPSYAALLPSSAAPTRHARRYLPPHVQVLTQRRPGRGAESRHA